MTEEEHRRHDAETERAIKIGVEKHGWFVLLFEAVGGEPSFGYTIGLWQTFKQPELIMFGLPPKTIHKF